MVTEQIGTMKENKSPDVDGIQTNFLIKTVHQLSLPLMKESQNKSENYRTICLTQLNSSN